VQPSTMQLPTMSTREALQREPSEVMLYLAKQSDCGASVSALFLRRCTSFDSPSMPGGYRRKRRRSNSGHWPGL
jgi:hypothetical protein